MTRYRFAEVRSALREHWGLALYRGGEMSDGAHDGRWDVTYSRTGFVAYGDLPGRGHGGIRPVRDACPGCDVVWFRRGHRAIASITNRRDLVAIANFEP